MTHNGNASMTEQHRPECVVEAVPEDPSHPDGATDMYLIFDGPPPDRAMERCYHPSIA